MRALRWVIVILLAMFVAGCTVTTIVVGDGCYARRAGEGEGEGQAGAAPGGQGALAGFSEVGCME